MSEEHHDPLNPSVFLTLEDVRRALALRDFDVLAAWQRMAPRPRPLQRPPDREGNAKPAGVLILLYPLNGVLTFVLTRRSDAVATHKRQISLPGGAVEPGETPEQTALRETCEEIGVCSGSVELIGALTPVYVVVSDFEIHPFVGYLPRRPAFRPDPIEVAGLLEMPLPTLLDDASKARERWIRQGESFDIPFYRCQGQIIWGATAIILSEFEARLRAVLASRL